MILFLCRPMFIRPCHFSKKIATEQMFLQTYIRKAILIFPHKSTKSLEHSMYVTTTTDEQEQLNLILKYHCFTRLTDDIERYSTSFVYIKLYLKIYIKKPRSKLIYIGHSN